MRCRSTKHNIDSMQLHREFDDFANQPNKRFDLVFAVKHASNIYFSKYI